MSYNFCSSASERNSLSNFSLTLRHFEFLPSVYSSLDILVLASLLFCFFFSTWISLRFTLLLHLIHKLLPVAPVIIWLPRFFFSFSLLTCHSLFFSSNSNANKLWRLSRSHNLIHYLHNCTTLWSLPRNNCFKPFSRFFKI